MKYIYLLLLFFVSYPSAAATFVFCSEEVLPGEPLPLYIYSEESLEGVNSAITSLDGKLINTARSFNFSVSQDVSVIVSFLAIPSKLPSGKYKVTVSKEDGKTPFHFEKEIKVGGRTFEKEEIQFSKAMSALKESDDPQKASESRQLYAILIGWDKEIPAVSSQFIIPVTYKRISSSFGEQRKYLYSDNKSEHSIHNGLDLAAPTGTPVVACGGGRIVFAGNRILTGNSIVIEHLPGVFSVYFHLDTLLVQKGDQVVKGYQVGTVGATGFVTGPHLHWEIRVNGIPVDPYAFTAADILDKAKINGMIKAAINKERG